MSESQRNNNLTGSQIWSIGENLKPLEKDFNIHLELDSKDWYVSFNGQNFYFDNYKEYTCFIKGFKFAHNEKSKEI